MKIHPRTSAIRNFCAIALLFAYVKFGTSPVSAVAFRLPNQDPEAIARGNAFAATADNPSAIYYNPAGITQLEGHNLSAGVYLVSASTKYTSHTGATAKTDATPQPVPQLYYVYTPNDSKLSYGVGVYAPYGLSLDWGDNPPFRTIAEKGSLLYACVNPVIAWKAHPTLSLAIGPTINYSEAELHQGIGILPTDEFSFKGNGVNYGFNAGILWQPHPMWSFGVNYRNSTTIAYEGPSLAKPFFSTQLSSASIRFPQFVVGGISFRPTPKWNIEFDLDWTHWSEDKQILFENTSFGNVPFILNYKDSFMYEVGVTRKFDNGYFASVGYFYSENSVPDKSFDPIIPDGNLHLGSFGFGHKGDRWNWAVAYHFATNGDGRDVKGSVPGLSDGNYKTFNQAINISLTWHFKREKPAVTGW